MQVNLRNGDGGLKNNNNYKRLKGSLGKRIEIERVIQAVPWAKHTWGATSGQTHSSGTTRSNAAGRLMSAARRTQRCERGHCPSYGSQDSPSWEGWRRHNRRVHPGGKRKAPALHSKTTRPP